MKGQIVKSICAVFLLTIIVVGSTYAFFTATAVGNRNINADSSDFEVIYTGGTAISGEMPITTDKTNAFKTTVNIRMGDNSVLAQSTLYITINQISENLRVPGFKWEVYKVENNTEVFVNNGSFDGYNSTTNNRVNIVNDYTVTRTNTAFVIYLWVDGSVTGNSVLGGTFSGYIGAESEPFTGELLDANNTYQFVEYLLSSGTQYIDTGLTGHMNYKYEIKFQQTVSGNYRIWGAFNQASYIGPNMSLTLNNSNRAVRWESRNGYNTEIDLDTMNTNLHTVVIDNGAITYDNQSKGTTAGHNTNFVVTKNLYLFTINPGDTAVSSNFKGRIYSYKVWNNYGQLIQDFMPAYRRTDNIKGMYDRINDKFYTNIGTGYFDVGPNISV